MLKFVIDEDQPRSLTHLLSQQGHEVTSSWGGSYLFKVKNTGEVLRIWW